MPTKKATPQRKPHHREDAAFQTAMTAYEGAMKPFLNHNWPKAKDAFAAFLAQHGENREVTDIAERARVHLTACEKMMAPPPANPETPEDWLLVGVLRANAGEIEAALAALDKAAEHGAPNARVNYVRAAALALDGQSDPALAALAVAIENDPNCRFQVLADPDFERLREEPGYVALVEPPSDGEGGAFDSDLEDQDDDIVPRIGDNNHRY